MKINFYAQDASSIVEAAESNRSSDLFELLAVYLVLFVTSVLLVISSWSAILLVAGAVETGGPIGFVMEMFISSGIL